MKTDDIVAAAVYMVLNAPTDDSVLDRAVAMIREIADHIDDTNLGQLLEKALTNYGDNE